MTILVTGGTGHIGNVLIRELAAKGQPVRALVLPGEDRSILDGVPVDWAEGNVLDPASLAAAFDGWIQFITWPASSRSSRAATP